MARKQNIVRQGFSLIELVIVVVIIGIIAAIAIPKMSRGSAGAGDSALQGNLAVLRNAVELYNSEHAALPSGTAANVIDQLTAYTNSNGQLNLTKTKDVANGYSYGPYLRKMPPLPVGSKKGKNGLKVATSATAPASADVEAWLYYTDTGEIRANLDDAEKPDGSTTPYNSF